MANQHFLRTLALSNSAAKATALLNRYPDLTEQELASLIRKFKNLPLLDFGLLAADEQLGGKLDEFYRDHGDKVRAPLSALSWTMALLAVVVIVLLVWAAT